MRHKYVVRYRTNRIDGYTVVSKHRTPSDAIDSAWSFVKGSHEDAKHLVVSVFSGDVCIYRIFRSENTGVGRHSMQYRYKSDYGDFSRDDAHYAVFENDGGRIKPLVDYGNNMHSAVNSAGFGHRRALGFFTEKRKWFAFVWCSLLVFAMVLFALLCLVMAMTARSGFDQGVSVVAVIFSLVVVYEVVRYVSDYWRSCSYVNFDVMHNADRFLDIQRSEHVE